MLFIYPQTLRALGYRVALVYLTQHHPVEELYDVAADPYEFNNLAFNTDLRPTLEKMRVDVRDWMHSQNDEGRREE